MPNPLRGPTSDAAYVAGILKTISGPMILVGHSYYLVGTLDKVIPPYAQLFMAQRAKAQISYAQASHLSIISQPDVTADLIFQALEMAKNAM